MTDYSVVALTYTHPNSKAKRQGAKDIESVLVLPTPSLRFELLRIRKVVWQHSTNSRWHQDQGLQQIPITKLHNCTHSYQTEKATAYVA